MLQEQPFALIADVRENNQNAKGKVLETEIGAAIHRLEYVIKELGVLSKAFEISENRYSVAPQVEVPAVTYFP